MKKKYFTNRVLYSCIDTVYFLTVHGQNCIIIYMPKLNIAKNMKLCFVDFYYCIVKLFSVYMDWILMSL